MKVRNLFFAVLASAAVFVGCEKEEDLGDPAISVNPESLTFEQGGATKSVKVTASRDWNVVKSTIPSGYKVEPMEGTASSKATEVKITAPANTEYNITDHKITFSAVLVEATLTVSQEGAQGNPSDLIVYHNDFEKDKTKPVEKTYGPSGKSWPYLDQYEDWHNETGSGAENVTYSYVGTSVRASGNSNEESDYAGSGVNSIFFGTMAHLQLDKIALGEAVDYTLSFGLFAFENFDVNKFLVYVSKGDGKWVKLNLTANNSAEHKWHKVTSTFTLPADAKTISLYLMSDLTSIHHIDDVDLSVSATAGTTIDFAQGGEIGADVQVKDATVAEFIAANESNIQYYRLKGSISNINDETNGNFDLTDETGKVYVYGLTATKTNPNDKTFSTLELKEGDIVTLIGVRGAYNDSPQVMGAYFVGKEAGAPSLTVEKTEITASASATSATIKIKANTAWELASTEGGATIAEGGESGDTDETVTVNFSANEDTANDKIYKFTLTATATGVTIEPIVITITQSKKSEDGEDKAWNLVTDASSISAGDEIILVCGTKSAAASAFADKTYFNKVEATVSGNSVVSADAIKITIGGNADAWTLTTSEGLIGAETVKSLNFSGKGTTTWKISITENNAKIESTTSAYGWIQYNASSPRFLNYTSKQTDIQIYRWE